MTVSSIPMVAWLLSVMKCELHITKPSACAGGLPIWCNYPPDYRPV